MKKITRGNRKFGNNTRRRSRKTVKRSKYNRLKLRGVAVYAQNTD